MEGMQPAPEPGISACDEETPPRKSIESAAPDSVLRVASPGRRRKLADRHSSEPERVVTTPRPSTSARWSKTGPCKWSSSPGVDKENSGGNVQNASPMLSAESQKSDDTCFSPHKSWFNSDQKVDAFPANPFLQNSQTTGIEKLFKDGMDQMKSQMDALGAREAQLSGHEALLIGKEAQLSGKEAELERKILQLRQEDERLHQEKQSMREKKVRLDDEKAHLDTERKEMIFLESQYRSFKERTEAECEIKVDELEKSKSEIRIEAEKLEKLKSELQTKQEALDIRSKDLEDCKAFLEQDREKIANRKSMQDQKEMHVAAQEAVLEEMCQSMAENAAKRASHLQEEEKRLAKRNLLLQEAEARLATERSFGQQNQEACGQQDRLWLRLLHRLRCLFPEVVQSLTVKHGLSPLWLLRILVLVVLFVGWSRAPLVAPEQDDACPKLNCPKVAPCRTLVKTLRCLFQRIPAGPAIPQISGVNVRPQPRPQHSFVPVVPPNVTPAVCLPLGAWIEEAPRDNHSGGVAPCSSTSNRTSDFLDRAEVHSTDVWTLTPRGMFAAAVITTVGITTAFL